MGLTGLTTFRLQYLSIEQLWVVIIHSVKSPYPLSFMSSKRRKRECILSFTVEVKKSKDYYNDKSQRVHVEGDFPENNCLSQTK